MLPYIVRATALFSSLTQVLELGSTLLGIPPKQVTKKGRTKVAKLPKRKTPMEYTATGVELANAFARAKFFLDKPPQKGKGHDFYSINGALRFAVGHDLRVLRCASAFLDTRLEGKTVTNWLLDNGVPEAELRGLVGMRGIRVWKSLWLEKLIIELCEDETKHTYTYPV